MTLSPFVYIEDVENLVLPKDLVSIVPIGITSREQLFSILSKELKFPSWWGQNWDALNDCLRDFSWTNIFQITVIHHEIPAIGIDATETYLEILADAVKDWKSIEGHQLRVVFPYARKTVIEEILDRAYQKIHGETL